MSKKKREKKTEFKKEDLVNLSILVGQLGMFRTAIFEGRKLYLIDKEWLDKEIEMLKEIINKNL